jgi:hypothetical protein
LLVTGVGTGDGIGGTNDKDAARAARRDAFRAAFLTPPKAGPGMYTHRFMTYLFL